MRCVNKFLPDWSRPGLPTTASGVAQQGTCEIMLLLGLMKTRGKREEKSERRANENCGKGDARS